MELAKLFATVGFKVDSTGLTEFRKEMSDLKVQLKEAAVSTGKLKNQLTGLTAQFKAFQRMTDTRGVTKWMEGIQKSIVHLNNMQNQVGGNAQRSTHWADQFSASILKLHQALVGRKNEVAEYAQAVVHLAASFERLRAATAGMQRFRQVPASAVRGDGGGYGGGGGRRRGGQGDNGDTQYQNYWGRARGLGASPLAAFARPMLPTGMGMFNAVAAGYGVRELVAAGREMIAMEAKIKAISRSTQEFNENLAFVRKTADTLAMPIEEVGQTFSNVFMASRDKMANNQIYKVYEGFAKYFKILQLTPEQTKLAMRAVNQMYNKEKVQSEELVGQLGERAAGVIQLFAKPFGEGKEGVKKLFAAMKEGKVAAEYVTAAGEAAGRFAEKSGALAEVTQNSASAQERFNNSMKDFSKAMMDAGLEKMLKELFKALTALATVAIPWVTKRLKALNGIVDTTKQVFQTAKENVDGLRVALIALAGVLAVGGVLSFMGLLGGRLFWMSLNGLAAAASFWAMHKAMLANVAIALVLLKAYGDIGEANEGEANWVSWMRYNLEMAMIYLERFYYMFIIWKNKFKASFDLGDFVTDAISNVPILSSLGGAIGRAAYDISTNGITFGGSAVDLYNTKPAPVTKEVRGNAPNYVTINVNASNLKGVKDSPKETAQALSDIIQKDWKQQLGGLGIFP